MGPIMNSPLKIKEQAQNEAYEYFDKHVRKLQKLLGGSMDPASPDLQDNDVDAFRHAYVSGVFTLEYSESAADVLGRLNEFLGGDIYSNSKNPRALNMDLWNNSIGRKYGKESKSRNELLKKIHDALKKGELINHPNDPREYKGARLYSPDSSSQILVLKENASGRNELFFDLKNQKVMSTDEFIIAIQSGLYPSYGLRNIDGMLTPTSRSDNEKKNNLG